MLIKYYIYCVMLQNYLIIFYKLFQMSERITERRKFLEESGNQENIQLDHPLPESDDDEDYIDTGAAILNFYCTLVDLLGRCAPDSSVISLVRKTNI